MLLTMTHVKFLFGLSSILGTKPLKMIYIDVRGHALILLFDKYIYYVIFLDYFTKYT